MLFGFNVLKRKSTDPNSRTFQKRRENWKRNIEVCTLHWLGR